MKIEVFKDYDGLSKATADFIMQYVLQKPDALLCFPSGESPTGTLQYLVNYARQGKVDFSNCLFVGLDEWVGMDETMEGSCKHYMYTQFFDPLKIDANKIFFFNAMAQDLEKECSRIDDLIFKYGPIDIMLVGVGLNGHIGLNEPGTSFNLYAHHMALDEITKSVAQKYFSQATTLHEGITLGLKHLLEAKVAILIASGSKKATILAKAINGAVTNQVPASIFQKHPNGFVFLDEAAASGLLLK